MWAADPHPKTPSRPFQRKPLTAAGEKLPEVIDRWIKRTRPEIMLWKTETKKMLSLIRWVFDIYQMLPGRVASVCWGSGQMFWPVKSGGIKVCETFLQPVGPRFSEAASHVLRSCCHVKWEHDTAWIKGTLINTGSKYKSNWERQTEKPNLTHLTETWSKTGTQRRGRGEEQNRQVWGEEQRTQTDKEEGDEPGETPENRSKVTK